MINSKLKEENGISLIYLVIFVVVIIIVGNALVYNTMHSLDVQRLKNMQADIENLKGKVSSYYSQKGEIPKFKKYTNITELVEAGIISEAADKGDFYVIDLPALENLTINYGKDYEKLTSESTQVQVDQYKDIYIINETSHNIFYVDGIVINNKKHYTTYTEEEIDVKSVDLRYVDNVKIPEGYTYISGDIETGIIIQNNDNSSQYTWIVLENTITVKPIDIQVDNEVDFIKSANKYKGYYKNNTGNTVIYLSLEDNWSFVYDVEGLYKDKNGDTAYIPKGFSISETIGANKIDDGLLAKDSNNNEWVWISVPRNIYSIAKSETDYEKIEIDLKSYTLNYNNLSYSDKWYAIDGTTVITEDTAGLTTIQKALKNGCGLTYDEYINLRKKMYGSIYKNGGFWIGRYEAGTTVARTSSAASLTDAINKQDNYPYNYITCSQAQGIAISMITDTDYTSSLMFGIQWDLVCKFIETKLAKTQAEINSNSETWGNYNNVSFSIEKGKYSTNNGTSWVTVLNPYTKPASSNIILTTGLTTRNSVLNIYDFAGNVSEWTLQKSPTTDYNTISTTRGGSYNYTGATYVANYRLNSSYLNSDSYRGFRVCLYK